MQFRHQAYWVVSAVVLMCGLLPLPAQAQFAQQGPKLVGTSAGGQGSAVSLSGDGNTAIVGAPSPGNDTALSVSGAAWVFTRSGGVWSQQQEICYVYSCGSFSYPDSFGTSVSLSADGNTAIVGAWGVAEGEGAAFVYVRSSGVWIQQGVLADGRFFTESGPYEGISVSLSADGNTAIIGAPGVVICEPLCPFGVEYFTGAALVFTRSSDSWVEQAILIGTDINGMFGNTEQGNTVSLSGDGNTAIVNGGSSAGPAAFVWTHSTDGGWTQQAILVGGGGNTAILGNAALSNSGNTAIFGNADGAVVYARLRTTSGIAWSQEATLPGAGATAPGPFGFGNSGHYSVSLSADGNTAMVGTSVFTRSEEVGWTQQELPAGTGAVGDASAQGLAVALSGDGYTATVGGPDDNSGTGATWVYSEFVFPGTPGMANCHGQRTAGIARKYGGFNGAVAGLGFSNLPALQDAVLTFCEE